MPQRETIYRGGKTGRAGPCKCGEAAFVFPLLAKGKFSPPAAAKTKGPPPRKLFPALCSIRQQKRGCKSLQTPYIFYNASALLTSSKAFSTTASSPSQRPNRGSLTPPKSLPVLFLRTAFATAYILPLPLHIA